ncbi:MAG: hypothetical protein JWN38_854 [Candidatus Saccharibacteria bacterium]|nr:hypothetical protein [Candidatus Saccharibacteria bacterium]
MVHMSEREPNFAESEKPGQIRAPFSSEQVAALNIYQTDGIFHPFTCGNDVLHDAQAADGQEQEWLLVATPEGWTCSSEACDYTQEWAWDFMADPMMLDRDT